MTHAANISGWMPLLTIYLGIGCIIGLFEYGIARYAFRNHTYRDGINQSEMVLTCVLKNAVAWPVILFWLSMLGLLKLYLLFRKRE